MPDTITISSATADTQDDIALGTLPGQMHIASGLSTWLLGVSDVLTGRHEATFEPIVLFTSEG